VTDDLISDMFGGIDDYYPNSKRKRKKIEPKKQEVQPDKAWDVRPRMITLPNQKKIETFTIGALAQALGRPIVTIRVWITEGYIPSAPYRLPDKKNLNGKNHKGNRLYSRAMVEKVIELFDLAGILYVKRIDWSSQRQLSNEIAEAWSKIRADETKQ
jgi:hypothetical protein